MNILLLKLIWHGIAFIFHRLKVTLNGNATDHTKCEKEVLTFFINTSTSGAQKTGTIDGITQTSR
jgi:hypothetical protein